MNLYYKQPYSIFKPANAGLCFEHKTFFEVRLHTCHLWPANHYFWISFTLTICESAMQFIEKDQGRTGYELRWFGHQFVLPVLRLSVLTRCSLSTFLKIRLVKLAWRSICLRKENKFQSRSVAAFCPKLWLSLLHCPLLAFTESGYVKICREQYFLFD